MKCAIYNPYLDTLGGGERYTMTFAKALSEKGYRVDVQWNDKDILLKIEERFGLHLKDVNVVSDIKKGDSYDVCFWISDGSIPMLRARNNILHFQIPFCDVAGRTLMNKMKLFRINNVVCNSIFTKTIIDKEFGINSKVIYPPIDTTSIYPKQKKNIILSVGRFSQLKQAKRQDVLIRAYKKLTKYKNKKWKLIFAGGSEVGAVEFIKNLKKDSLGFNIDIIENPSYNEIVNLYSMSKIFWSASGYGIDEKKNPENVEHFGMSLVEAMSGGCAVLAFDAGGHKEIIKDSGNGYLWKSIEELNKYTQMLIDNKTHYDKIIKTAVFDSTLYSYDKFSKSIETIV